MKHRILSAIGAGVLALAIPMALMPNALAVSRPGSAPLGATSTTFGGYTAPIPQGKATKSWVSNQVYLEPDSCEGMPDGTTWTSVINTLDSSGNITLSVTKTIICYLGTSQIWVLICPHGKRCTIMFDGVIFHPGWQAGRVAPTGNGNGTVITETDPATGKLVKRTIKGVLSVASVEVGYSATDSSGNPMRVSPFPGIKFSKVTVGDVPLASAHPTPVTLYQDGAPVVSPSAIGSDGESFSVSYVGP